MDDKVGGAETVGVAGFFVGHDFGEDGDGVVEGTGEAVGGIGDGFIGGIGEGSVKGGVGEPAGEGAGGDADDGGGVGFGVAGEEVLDGFLLFGGEFGFFGHFFVFLVARSGDGPQLWVKNRRERDNSRQERDKSRQERDKSRQETVVIGDWVDGRTLAC